MYWDDIEYLPFQPCQLGLPVNLRGRRALRRHQWPLQYAAVHDPWSIRVPRKHSAAMQFYDPAMDYGKHVRNGSNLRFNERLSRDMSRSDYPVQYHRCANGRGTMLGRQQRSHVAVCGKLRDQRVMRGFRFRGILSDAQVCRQSVSMRQPSIAALQCRPQWLGRRYDLCCKSDLRCDGWTM